MQRFGLCSAVLLFLFLTFIHGYRWRGEGESKHGGLKLASLLLYRRATRVEPRWMFFTGQNSLELQVCCG